MKHPFNESELLVILEAARIAFADCDLFDDLCDQLDIDDGELSSIREKLVQYMNQNS
jgi:hypothetical protein